MYKYQLIKPGDRFGILTVIEEPRLNPTVNGSHRWVLCECDCSNIIDIRCLDLMGGSYRSCGCLKKSSHATYYTRLYNIWYHMKSRCYNPNVRSYKTYGGRGIGVCEEWLKNFSCFEEWALSSGYKEDLTIERIDINKDYNPENCCWIPKPDQGKNKTTSRYIVAWGEKKTLAEWGRDPRCIVSRMTICKRLAKGWSPEKAISEQKRKNQFG